MIYLKFLFCLVFIRIVTSASIASREFKIETPFSIAEFLTFDFTAIGSWLSDGRLAYQKASDQNYYKLNVTSKEEELFLNHTFMSNYSEATMSFSPDESYVLIRYNESSDIGRSKTASYAVYNIAQDEYYEVNEKMPVQLASFDSTDIKNSVRVTEDGEVGEIFNGISDWVYEEEVLESNSALWFSPDGNYLTYAKFNDTNVKMFKFIVYGNDQYPTIREVKYPKVGSANPIVDIFIYNTNSKSHTKLELIDSIHNNEENNDFVFYGITWISNDILSMISTNRVQNESVIIRCVVDGSCKKEVSYSESNGWLSPQVPQYNKDGKQRLEILPQPHEDDYFTHLVLTDTSTNTSKRLTFGHRVVTKVYGWDVNNNLIYYEASVNNSPSQQQVSVVNTETLEDKCLTCDFIVDNEPCLYAAASFNSLFSYYLKTCQGPNPYYGIVQSVTDINDVIVWAPQSTLRDTLKEEYRNGRKDIVVTLSSNFTARVRLILPPNFDETKKYPALVEVYAGPGFNQIKDSFQTGITNYFVPKRNYIGIHIDGRGSGRDGQNKMFQIYKRFGTIEIEDQIEVTKYLQDNYPFIDRNRTGIWGWSYGGFASSFALVKDTENVFQFAVAIAPVTSFLYYDSIYCERFMGLPTEEDNLIGYQNTDLTKYVKAFRGKLYFIIHGSADDNVHYQNAMVLIDALETADIGFWQQTYPDKSHVLLGVILHLYHTLDKFWERAFRQSLDAW